MVGGLNPAGLYTITATYTGGTNFLDSVSFKTLTLNPAAVNISSSNTTANLAVDLTVTFSATITSTAGLVNEGTVTFTVRNLANNVVGVPVTSATVASGQASADFDLSGLNPGTYKVTAVFSGSTNYLTKTDVVRTLILS
jgi:hypothetical protein